MSPAGPWASGGRDRKWQAALFLFFFSFFSCFFLSFFFFFFRLPEASSKLGGPWSGVSSEPGGVFGSQGKPPQRTEWACSPHACRGLPAAGAARRSRRLSSCLRWGWGVLRAALKTVSGLGTFRRITGMGLHRLDPVPITPTRFPAEVLELMAPLAQASPRCGTRRPPSFQAGGNFRRKRAGREQPDPVIRETGPAAGPVGGGDQPRGRPSKPRGDPSARRICCAQVGNRSATCSEIRRRNLLPARVLGFHSTRESYREKRVAVHDAPMSQGGRRGVTIEPQGAAGLRSSGLEHGHPGRGSSRQLVTQHVEAAESRPPMNKRRSSSFGGAIHCSAPGPFSGDGRDHSRGPKTGSIELH